MRATIQKWGNSLALRIPKAYGKELGVGDSSAVELHIEKSKLIIKAHKKKKANLKQLLAMINEKNCHRAVETGPMVGREVW